MNRTDSITSATADTLCFDSVLWRQFVLTAEADDMETFTDTFQFGTQDFCLNDTLVERGIMLPSSGRDSDLRQYSPANNDLYPAGVLLLTFCTIAIIISKGRHLIAYRIKDFFHDKRQYSDENVNSNTANWRNTLALCSALSLSLSIIAYHHTLDYLDNTIWNPLLPVIMVAGCFIACLTWIYIKGLLYYFINWIFFDKETNKKWLNAYFLIYSLSIFIVFPISLLDIYGNITPIVTLNCLLGVLIFTKILLFFKVVSNFKARKNEYLFIFLYFCAVEILPSFSIWHIFSNTDRNLTFFFT